MTVEPADTFGRLGEKLSEILPATVNLDTLTLSNAPAGGEIKLLKEIAGHKVSQINIQNGDLVYITYKHVGAL